MKKLLINSPILSRSGYGEMARFALQALRQHEDKFDIYVNVLNWGQTGYVFEENEEYNYITSLRIKTEKYVQQSGGNPQFDVSLQITIPNEWKKMAPVNIGYTAGIETTHISPAWLQPSQQMDKIIVISEHAKQVFQNTVFQDEAGTQHKVTTPIEVVHFPWKKIEDGSIDLELPCEFNFLTVNQWGPRKNIEGLISAFIDEFRDEEIGLVIKTNQSADHQIDKAVIDQRLSQLVSSKGPKKCKIHLVHGSLTEKEMHGLYRHPKIKAFVTATHGEGFGMPIFEAVNEELPIIATNWSGHLDFLSALDKDKELKPMFAKVDFEIKAIQEQFIWAGVMEKGTGWAYPNISSLKQRMREVYKDYPRFKSWSKKLSTYNQEKFNKSKVDTCFVESVLGEKIVTVSIEELPKISIITSVFKGDEFIRPFLEDITRQTIFKDKCELILINANSPGNEEDVIKEYLEKYPNNIVYKKLDNDPGIYACWNIAAKMATGEFLTNANLDDRKSPTFMEDLAKQLCSTPEVDVVYADNLVTSKSNETWEKNTANSMYPSETFSLEAMLRGNPPHCMPMWRKILHEKHGYFEEKYRSASDWEFWLRCAFKDSKFKKVNKSLGLYYFNPTGMSTNPENNSWKQSEELQIFKKYQKLFLESRQ